MEMFVAWAPMAGRTKPLLLRRADMSERSVISYHKIQQYNKALEKTLQRLEHDAQNNILTQNLAAKKIKDDLEQRRGALVRRGSCDTQMPARSVVDESESVEWDKASASPRQAVTRRVVRSGSVGTLPLASTSLIRKAYEGDNADQAKCQQPLHASPVCKHTRTNSLGGEQSSLAIHRLSGDRKASMPSFSPYHPNNGKKRLIKRRSSDDFPGRIRMPTITLTKDANATVDEESETAFDSMAMLPPRSVQCNAWESRPNSALPPPLQRLPLSGSPILGLRSPATSSTPSMSSCSPGSPGPHRLGLGCEDECSTIAGSLLPIKTRERLTGVNEKRFSSGCISLSALKTSQTTKKEDLLEAARIMDFGPEDSKSPNPTMFRKFYSHVPVRKCASDNIRNVSPQLCFKNCLFI